ncbi:MAG: hypothetical protein A4E49_02437 [Methanosaeta sp. PtaU1.Bin112]|nr:MAG: hypothetical protein A4E49_02437 [Methanosaeta sp. PtaU1.Bin112]
MVDDLSVTSVSEDCGKWRITFNWSDMDEYRSSVSHGDSTSGKVAIATDAVTLESASDKSRILKISVIMYSKKDASLISQSSLMELANGTMEKSKVCKDIRIAERVIDGRSGIFGSGLKCPTNEPVYVAVYPIEYHLDRPGGILESTAVGLILSTYEQEVTERFINSVDVLQLK